MSHPGEAIVDVSNVCWSKELAPQGNRAPGPVLGRLLTLINAWRGLHGQDVPMSLVADRSLPHCLEPADRSRWKSLSRELGIRTAPVADELILAEAVNGRMWVLTRDHYIDHRRTHRWIEEFPQRFLCWQTVGGAVSFRPLGIVPQPHQVVSKHEEVKRLKGAGLDREILLTRWRCTDRYCLQARLWQDCLLLWPLVDRAGRVCCPSCRGELTALGKRAALRQLIVSSVDDPERELLRFPVEAGTPVVLGRGRLECGISLDAMDHAPARIGRLSRQHAVLRLSEQGVLSVVDMGSANGTELRNPGSPGFRRLESGRPANLADLGQLVLAGIVRLELSGQRFYPDPSRPSLKGIEAPATEISNVREEGR